MPQISIRMNIIKHYEHLTTPNHLMSGSAKVAFGINETNASMPGEISKLLLCILGESNGLCVLNYLTNNVDLF